MIIPVVGLLVILLPAVLGGRLIRLAKVRLRAIGVLTCSLLAQIVIIELLTGPEAVLSIVHVATYAGAGWFLWANRRVPGLLVVAAGALSNGVAIAANGGVLPASPHALAVAGMADLDGFANSAAIHDPRLWFLGDVFAIPAGWPLANVFSVGDLLILLGAAFASVRICGTRWSSPVDGSGLEHSADRGTPPRPLPECPPPATGAWRPAWWRPARRAEPPPAGGGGDGDGVMPGPQIAS